ncbi:MAG: hypothetical protein RIQ53_3542 [Pseudomonadota bacterium]|jgi:peptidoglycan/xylan/chitin deacetylase (PgdA/CDA1 family)
MRRAERRRALAWLAAVGGGGLSLWRPAVAAPAAAVGSTAVSVAASVSSGVAGSSATAPGVCAAPVYLTLDTGHMGVAELIGRTLVREQVPATFFLAAERTLDGGHSLDARWAPWWRERVAEGHLFGSHTWDHARWRRDLAEGRFVVQPEQGERQGQRLSLDGAAYCAELVRPARRLAEIAGRPVMVPLFRAPGGRLSPALEQAAARGGWQHVGWTPAGFLGDELSTARAGNAALLEQALARVRPGDILLAHLGIWSRQPPWAPEVFAPLIQGLKARGLCFATLQRHPRFAAHAARPVALG